MLAVLSPAPSPLSEAAHDPSQAHRHTPRPAVRSNLPTTLDVLLTITPPPADTSTARPPLNLALVLDRSGSMGERNKMTFAREAAVFAVRELKPTDRVSVIAFDDKIEVVVANAPAADADAVVRKINTIHPRGSTALHGGWQEGRGRCRPIARARA